MIFRDKSKGKGKSKRRKERRHMVTENHVCCRRKMSFPFMVKILQEEKNQRRRENSVYAGKHCSLFLKMMKKSPKTFSRRRKSCS